MYVKYLFENTWYIFCIYRAMLAQSTIMRLHVVRLSVRNNQVPWSHRLEFFENNLTAE